MSANIHDAFEVCLKAIQTGVELDRCLALYPELTDELRPALEAAQFAQMLTPPPPSGDAERESKTMLLGLAAGLRTSRRPRIPWGLPRLALVGLTAMFVVLFTAGSLISASAQSIPGDVLYPAKQASERLNLSIAGSAERQRELTENYLDRRIDEIQQLFAQGRSEEVVFQGNLTSIEDGIWIVGDIDVLIRDDLVIPEELAPGVKLEITGTVNPDGWIEAQRVTVKVFKIDGLVTRIEGDTWLVGSREITITDLSLIEEGLHIGDHVLILVNVESDGHLIALAIIEGRSIDFEDADDRDSPSDDDPDENELDDDDPSGEDGEDDPDVESSEEGDSEDDGEGAEIDGEDEEPDDEEEHEEEEEEEEEDSEEDPSS